MIYDRIRNEPFCQQRWPFGEFLRPVLVTFRPGETKCIDIRKSHFCQIVQISCYSSLIRTQSDTPGCSTYLDEYLASRVNHEHLASPVKPHLGGLSSANEAVLFCFVVFSSSSPAPTNYISLSKTSTHKTRQTSRVVKAGEKMSKMVEVSTPWVRKLRRWYGGTEVLPDRWGN